MLAPQRTGPLYPLHSYAYPNQGTVTFQSTIFDVNWYETWPIIRSILVASMMVLSSAAIIGLDIANLAIEGSKTGGSAMLGSGTAKVGAGIWSGSISFLAAIFIIMISKSIFHKPTSISSWFLSSSSLVLVRNKRIAATFALLAVILAFFFSIVLVGLSANAVQLDQYFGDSILNRNQYKLMIAILSLAAFNITLCLAFFIMYITVFFSSPTRPSLKY
jgi:hypothetical protein